MNFPLLRRNCKELMKFHSNCNENNDSLSECEGSGKINPNNDVMGKIAALTIKE